MMGLLVYKEKLKNFYAEHEFYVNPIIKFISAFIALTLIKKNVGYNDLLTMWPVIREYQLLWLLCLGQL